MVLCAFKSHRYGISAQELVGEKGISPDTVALLKQRGHKVALKASMGRTQTIQLRGGMLYGASDPRNPDGKTLGY